MKLYSDKLNSSMVLKAAFEKEVNLPNLIETDGAVTEFHNKNEAFVFIKDKDKADAAKIAGFIGAYLKANRFNFQVDLATFVTEKATLEELFEKVFMALAHDGTEVYSAKKRDRDFVVGTIFVKDAKKFDAKAVVLEAMRENINFVKKLQNMPPNIANSEWIAKLVVEQAKKFPNVEVQVLGRKEAIENRMGLYLSVNKGSMFEPQVVVVRYKGNPKSKDTVALVGKGITFDSGGYNLKPEKYMLGMKFDMSGAAIAAGTVMTLSKTDAKVNATAVMMLTDNRVNGDASLPDSIVTSMSGITVEINNTDAEGRLVLADGITYAIEKEGATKVVDIATLTGAILYTLGREYTGTWATHDEDFASLEVAAKATGEKFWRMPLHENYLKFMKGSKLADLFNTDLSGLGGSNSAAMFLKQFAKETPYMHLDIAGTADDGALGTAATLPTLVKFLEGQAK